MKTFRTLSCKVTGYRKKAAGKPCEDALKVVKGGKYTVIAAADGHGDSRCIFADVGAAIAVKSACDIITGYTRKLNKRDLPSEFWNSQRQEIAADIVRRYAELCLADYENKFANKLSSAEKEMVEEYIIEFNKKSEAVLSPNEIREKYARRKTAKDSLEKVLYLYGTTLRASLVCDEYVFSLAIGDGDTVMLTDRGIRWLIPKSPAYETSTYSMCDDFSSILSEFMFSYGELKSGVRAGISENSHDMKMIVLCTDGFRNSFFDDGDFVLKLEDIYASVCKKGTRPLSRPMKRLFARLSRQSVYQDDISAVFGAFFDC